MSNIVDDRVVKMQFDNANFEKNVSTSISTLDRLKKSLDFSKSEQSLQGLQNVSNKFSMDKIGASLEAIQNRFSTMGIVGMTIIQNLTNSALGALGNISHKIGDMIIQGGISRAMNIENAKFQLEGLGIEYKDVFDAIDYAVTNTAYGLDAAAQAAAQLSAAGLDYKNVIMTHKQDGEELTQMSMALRAVSGVAAQTQSEYSMVARYFQDVANAGKVTGATLTYMTQVLNLPVEQNLAEGLKAIADGSAEASESVQKAVKDLTKGTEVSAEQIKKWASKGLITFDMFSTVMFDKYADHAVDANRTVTGVMANIRAAFSKIGAEFVSPLIEIDGIVVQMFESIRRRINEIKPMIIPFAKSLTDAIKMIAGNVKGIIDNLDLTWMKSFFKGLAGLIDGLAKGINVFKSAWDTMFKSDRTAKLKTFSENFQKFGETFSKSLDSLSAKQDLYDKFKGFLSLLNALKTVFNTLTQPFRGFIEGLKESISFSGSFIDGFVNWANNLNKLVTESEKLQEISQRLFDAGKLIGSSIGTLVSDVVGVFKSIKEGPTSFVESIFDGLITDLGHTLIKIVEILSGKDLSRVVEIYDKVVNVVKNITEALAEVFNKGLDSIGNFIAGINNLFSGIKINDSAINTITEKLDSDLSPLEKIFTAFSAAFDLFLNIIKSIMPTIKTVGKNLLDTISSIIDGIKKAFDSSTFGNTLRNTTFSVLLYNLKNVFIQIKNIIKLINVKNPLGPLNDFATQARDTLVQMEKNFNANYFLKVAGSILMLAFAMNMIANIDPNRLEAATAVILVLLGSLNMVAKALSTSSILNSESSGFLGMMKKISKAEEQRSMIEGMGGLIAIASAIFILAKAIKEVADIEDPNALVRSVIAIEVLLASMIGIGKLLSTNAKDEAKIMSGMSGLIALALSIKVLASAAKDFASMEWGELGKAGAAIGTLMIALTAFAKIMQSTEISNGFGKGGVTKQTQGMIQLGLGLILLASAIKIFASAAKDFGGMDWSELGKAGAAIGTLMIALTAFAKIMESKTTTGFMSSSKTQSANMIQLGISLVLLGESMKLFAQAAGSFAELNWEQLGKAGAAFTAIIAGISILSKLTSSSSMGFFSETNNLTKQNTAQNLITLGVGMIAIAAAMKVFASAAEDFAMLNWEQLGKAAISMGAIATGLSLFSHFTSGGNLLALSGGLMLFATAMLMLVPAIMAFGSLSLGGVILSLVEIAGVILLLSGLTKLVQPMIGAMNSLSLSLLLFGAALSAIGAGLILLSSGVAAASGSIVAILGLIKTIIIGIVETIHELVPLIVETVVDIIDQFLITLTDHIPSMVDSILTILIKVLEVLKTRLPELAGPILGVVNGLADIFKQQLGTIDTSSFLMAIGGISAFMVLLVGSAVIAQKALLGVAAISLVMAEVTAMFLILSRIDANSTLAIAQGLSETLLALSISTAILTLVGVGAEAALAGVAALAIVIAGIVAVLAALGGLKQIPGFDWLMSEGMQVLNQIGLAIGEFVGNIVGGIAIGVTDGFPAIADNLSAFMTRLNPFITGLKSIDSQVAEAALSLAGIILALTAADILDSLTSWFTGGIDMAKFGQELARFGPYIMQFANSVRGINGDDVESAANAGKALAEMASALPNEGGVLGWFMGENDMEEFGKKLVPFGKAMMEYSKSVEGLDAGVVENSASAGKAVAELASSLPNSGGVAGWFMGENDMNLFGEQLVIFGKKLAAYSVYVSNLDGDVVTKSANAAKSVAELANNLPNSGGLVSWFTGDNSMDVFGEQIVEFGKSIVKYSNVIKDLDAEVMIKTSSAIAALVELSNGLPNTGGLVSWFTGDNDLSSFGSNLISFGSSLAEFGNSLSGVDLSPIPSLVTNIKELVNLASLLANIDTSVLSTFSKDASVFVTKFSTMGLTYVDEFLKQFTSAVDKVNSAIESFVQFIINALTEREPLFYQEGFKSIEQYAQGMRTGEGEVRRAAENIIAAAISAFSGAKGKFYRIGVDIIEGLVAGLNDKDAVDSLSSRLKQLASMAEEGTKKQLDSHSPSKVFAAIGRDIVLGLVVGIGENNHLAKEASSNMADETIKGMSNAISKINDIISDDINTDPVITPVLDMSSLESDAYKINELFNRSIKTSNIKASTIPQQNNQAVNSLQNEDSKSNTTFIQNNYSPKALSRTEIYRQTKNQFAQYREAFS